MLYIIGIGLNSFKDLSLRSVEILKKCKVIYLENYTCFQYKEMPELEEEGLAFLKNVKLVDRHFVEELDVLTEESINGDVAFLVVGTPLFATTHSDIIARAAKKGIETKIIHNVSISNVMGSYGLYSYNFGGTVSIPFFTKNNVVLNNFSILFDNIKGGNRLLEDESGWWLPVSFYEKILLNYEMGLHTLVLLDIKRDINRYMNVNEAISHLEYAENIYKKELISENTKIFAICRFATDEESVYFDTISNLKKKEFGKPLHSLIIPAKLSIVEEEFVKLFSSFK